MFPSCNNPFPCKSCPLSHLHSSHICCHSVLYHAPCNTFNLLSTVIYLTPSFLMLSISNINTSKGLNKTILNHRPVNYFPQIWKLWEIKWKLNQYILTLPSCYEDSLEKYVTVIPNAAFKILLQRAYSSSRQVLHQVHLFTMHCSI